MDDSLPIGGVHVFNPHILLHVQYLISAWLVNCWNLEQAVDSSEILTLIVQALHP